MARTCSKGTYLTINIVFENDAYLDILRIMQNILLIGKDIRSSIEVAISKSHGRNVGITRF